MMFRQLIARGLSTSVRLRAPANKTMKQIEVDEPEVRAKLGRLQMDMVNR